MSGVNDEGSDGGGSGAKERSVMRAKDLAVNRGNSRGEKGVSATGSEVFLWSQLQGNAGGSRDEGVGVQL